MARLCRPSPSFLNWMNVSVYQRRHGTKSRNTTITALPCFNSLKAHFDHIRWSFEFETNSKALFFPTLHIHDGKVHPTEEFDHELYLQHAGFDSTVGAYVTSGHVDPSTHLTRSRFTATRFCSITETKGIIEKDLMVHRKITIGTVPVSFGKLFLTQPSVSKSRMALTSRPTNLPEFRMSILPAVPTHSASRFFLHFNPNLPQVTDKKILVRLRCAPSKAFFARLFTQTRLGLA